MGPEPMAKLRQDLLFGSPEWSLRDHGLRSTIEATNGYLKDGSRHALDDPQRRRVRGVGAQSLFVALLVFAANYDKIQEFLKKEGTVSDLRRRRPRRRVGRSISDWQPAPTSVPQKPEASGSP